MLRFNFFDYPDIFIPNEFQYILCYGSTVRILTNLLSVLLFQYILCYGSTAKKMFMIVWFRDFNTSYVTVQPLRFI